MIHSWPNMSPWPVGSLRFGQSFMCDSTTDTDEMKDWLQAMSHALLPVEDMRFRNGKDCLYCKKASGQPKHIAEIGAGLADVLAAGQKPDFSPMNRNPLRPAGAHRGRSLYAKLPLLNRDFATVWQSDALLRVAATNNDIWALIAHHYDVTHPRAAVGAPAAAAAAASSSSAAAGAGSRVRRGTGSCRRGRATV